jgi:ABC-type multidrug transport system ATPase subunit
MSTDEAPPLADHVERFADGERSPRVPYATLVEAFAALRRDVGDIMAVTARSLPAASPSETVTAPIEALDVRRRFGEKVALDGVSLRVARGEIGALLGPNGAGKTTLLRILCGLMDADSGTVRVMGEDARRSPRELRGRIGLVPSGDRSFYLRLTGLQNLVFFARLHGLSRRAAGARSLEVLEDVGLGGAERRRVGLYSHGMQKRLSVARALLMKPEVMLIDEATHDLDPEGARQVRELVAGFARRGTAVLWTTQRLDEIRGFADSVTLISGGEVRFAGSVPELMSHALAQRYVLRVENGALSGKKLEPSLQSALGSSGTIRAIAGGNSNDFVLSLREDAALGDALRSLLSTDVQIHACREERSQIEEAFILLSGSQNVATV